MKKYWCIVLLFLLVFGMPVAVFGGEIEVVVDGEIVEFHTALLPEDGRMLVPMRELLTAMGADVTWDNETRTAVAEVDNIQVCIPIGSYLPTVNDVPVAIDVPAMFINNRTFIPLRFAAESLGGKVSWDAVSGTAFITTAGTANAGQENEDGLNYMNRIDINSADLETLLGIDGLSEVVAAEILAYREANGLFSNFAEIRDLPSMTDSLFRLLLDNIRIVYTEQGEASWYGADFHGRRTSSGEVYNMYLHTAAHRTLPFGTMVRVFFPRTGQSVWVRINDRGPHIPSRIIDLSRSAADAIGLTPYGVGRVEIEVVMES